MGSGRSAGISEVKADSSALAELSQAAREGRVLGVGICGLNPSGCYDIAKGISSELYNIPVVRVNYEYDTSSDPDAVYMALMMGARPPRKYEFLDKPQLNAKCDTVFFTGCGIYSSSMSSVLKSLSQQYKLTNIRHVYQILPPHHPEGMQSIERDAEDSSRFFKNTPYQYKLLYSGMDSHDPSNIGMPQLELKESEFKVPAECYGIMRHRHMDDFLPRINNECLPEAEKYLHEYFRQVADAGKDCATKPLTVIAIGFEPSYRQRILEIAQKYSINMDFCDKYPNYRLPKQSDFFHALSVMREKKGIVSFDGTSTQCLLQAISLDARTMIYQPYWREFYAELVSLVPAEDQPTARVIFGLSDDYELFKNRAKCQKIYALLHAEVNKAHQRFEAFKSCKSSSAMMTAQMSLPASNVNSLTVAAAPASNTGELPIAASSGLTMGTSRQCKQGFFADSGKTAVLAKESDSSKEPENGSFTIVYV